MTILLEVCCLTTVIAIVSAMTAAQPSFQHRILPWVGGALVGIAVFWVLPEMAIDRGWLSSLSSIAVIFLLLGLVDRYVYPICPFCAAGVHTHDTSGATASCGRVITSGWPLLIVGCLHSFFDGWTIGFSQDALSNSAAALFWGVTIHKIPESVAIGLLAARLTSTRNMALGAIFLVQAAMTVGGVLAVIAGNFDNRWASICAVPACALLLLMGVLALRQEWRLRGGIAAMRAAAPGVVGCGLFALATNNLLR